MTSTWKSHLSAGRERGRTSAQLSMTSTQMSRLSTSPSTVSRPPLMDKNWKEGVNLPIKHLAKKRRNNVHIFNYHIMTKRINWLKKMMTWTVLSLRYLRISCILTLLNPLYFICDVSLCFFLFLVHVSRDFFSIIIAWIKRIQIY